MAFPFSFWLYSGLSWDGFYLDGEYPGGLVIADFQGEDSFMRVEEGYGGYLVLVLDKPKQGNSLGSEEVRVLNEVVRKTARMKGIVLRSEGGHLFCAGGNLEEQRAIGNRAKSLLVQRNLKKALDSFVKLGKPTIAVVRGDVLGGGVEFLSAFDYILATPDSGFGLWQRKIGLTFGWGGGSRLLERLSRHSLIASSLGARFLSAYEAKGLGLIDEVAPAAQLEERLQAYLRRQARLPEVSFAPLKSWTSTKAEVLFGKLWMNPHHQSVLKSRSR